MIQTEQLHPRPSGARSRWQSLDGDWDFARDPEDRGLREGWNRGDTGPWDERITVPYAWESPASGIEAHWLPIGWYRRRFEVLPEWSDLRTFMIIGGVHHEATVWVDGVEVAHVAGGHAGLECELPRTGGESMLIVVRVVNPIDKRFVPHGKQRSLPADDFDGCQFTPSSGIWQTVWVEPRPELYVRSLSLQPNEDLTGFRASIETGGVSEAATVSLAVGDEPAVVTAVVDGHAVIDLPIAEPRLWSPDDPFLYEVTATLHPGGSGSDDVVTSTTGLRRIEAQGSALYLNGEQLYLRGVLDQGYWPDGGLTAPGPEALLRDLELARDAGFTLVRKHLKFEDPRQLHYADRLGMLMWVEPPSIGRFTPEAVNAFESLVPEMILKYGNHPSVIIWGLYNEEWGLDWQAAEDPERAATLQRISELAHRLDPTRLVVDDSGWSHVETDIVDWHVYTDDLVKWDDVVARSAAGTLDILPIGLGPDALDRPLWAREPDGKARPNLNTEYGVGHTSLERGWHLRWQTQRLRREDAISGYIYCELTDIEHETAGTYTFDRRRKDLGGTIPADVHRDTVLIPDLIPVRPGADLLATAGQEIVVNVAVSHRGSEPFVGRLGWSWEGSDHDAGSIDVTVKPHVCSEPLSVRTTVPPARPAGAGPRLRLVALQTDDTMAGHTFVDVELQAH
ncbi:glycoside hydrolase family 2 protein [Microlunatus parietis]|uniref:Beta-galactosidase/beta-glucuronidase n=1 Tax=Microlunatus parietis TaxID=682979 RepID=A0A7Y9I889_9ACTN|nr:sugar-binding domain-containing protein [Microlunatus parietis]NYE72080.1 beta-galactosidase/beta-glucuronidase [Microlunatus parietis]